jgi:lactate permease
VNQRLPSGPSVFKAVVWHSIFLAVVVGAITLAQAYLYPFTLLVPHPAGPAGP